MTFSPTTCRVERLCSVRSPFLSVYTPTYKRPTLLDLCKVSVSAQTIPTEHVLVHDEVGVGISGVYADLPLYAHRVTGQYVMVLSDDNILIDPMVAAEMRWEATGESFPDVVVFKGQIADTIQPLAWNCEPQINRIDLSCFAVRRPIWQAHAGDWGHRYEGDYDFIHTLWERGYRFHWWDRLVFRALQIGRGEPERVEAAVSA